MQRSGSIVAACKGHVCSLWSCVQIYFVGRSGAPKVKGNPHLTKLNAGYDDDRGDYQVKPLPAQAIYQRHFSVQVYACVFCEEGTPMA